ncbi:MAG: 2-hydroxyacyl-CoA dehydratase subunit D, partial [Bacillota bacterium]
PEIEKQYVQFNLAQLQELVAFLEKITGKKMDYDRLAEAIEAQEKAVQLYYEITLLRKASPCPVASEDMLAAMVPNMYAVDQAETIGYYTALRDEVKERVEKGIGVIPDEKFRLYWSGIPMWNTMGIFNYFESQGAVFVIEDYAPQEPIKVDLEGVHPLEALARLEYWRMGGYGSSGGEVRRRRLERGDIPDCHQAWAERVIEWAIDYKLDGQVRHLTLGCRAAGSGQPTHVKNVLEKHLGLPSLFLESDQIDIRSYSEAQIRAKVDAFLETLEAKREHRLRG